ncbi:Uncharacterised protein [Shigella sonnei]|nr:Uncharacterised protein [Shigella sonnei]CSF34835.1 Uncharacterised protein [Shigella sonnei]CSF52858.1 Uncharacterised protein [Shigella sonnei]CSG08413.1 Uncharacterised protein [Shigella sonnei]CSG33368.1 Uncharacterised protein [Shigella sonnei]
MHCQQVTIHNADIFHRHPADAQQEISIRLEQGRIDLIMTFNMLLRQKRFTGSHTTYQRQPFFLFLQQTNPA